MSISYVIINILHKYVVRPCQYKWFFIIINNTNKRKELFSVNADLMSTIILREFIHFFSLCEVCLFVNYLKNIIRYIIGKILLGRSILTFFIYVIKNIIYIDIILQHNITFT